MAGKLPYIASPGVIKKIVNKIMEAKTPDRFTSDFLKTKLSCNGGNYTQFISLGKKIGLLSSSGAPTSLYKKFRNPSTSEAAMAKAIKMGYVEVFSRNEFANDLDKKGVKGLVLEITGLEEKDKKVGLIVSTFYALKEFADFEKKLDSEASDAESVSVDGTPLGDNEKLKDLDLNLSYSINLVLPKTDDPAVFNAIFRSLRENLLRK